MTFILNILYKGYRGYTYKFSISKFVLNEIKQKLTLVVYYINV